MLPENSTAESALRGVLDRMRSDHGWIERFTAVGNGLDGDVVQIAARETQRILVHEPTRAAAIPDYCARRRMRAEIAPTPGDVLIFTDAAHSAFVWTRLRRVQRGGPLYEELRLPGDEALIFRDCLDNPLETAVPADTALAFERVMGTVRDSLSRIESGGEVGLDVLDWIESAVDAATIRKAFRLLDRIVVVDTRCRTGSWLLGAAAALETTRIAAVNRSRSLLADFDARRERRRPEYLTDLRRRLTEVRDADRAAAGPEHIRRFVIQRQVFGLADTRTTAERVRSALLDWAGVPQRQRCLLDANVRVARGPHAGEGDTPGSGSRVGHDGSNALSPVHPEAVLRAAWELAADARLAGGGDRREWRRAAAMLERRRRHLAHRAEQRRHADRVATGAAADSLRPHFPTIRVGRAEPLIIYRRDP